MNTIRFPFFAASAAVIALAIAAPKSSANTLLWHRFDGDGTTADADFEGVRGVFETNPFVAATTEHMKRKDALGKLWIDRLNGLSET